MKFFIILGFVALCVISIILFIGAIDDDWWKVDRIEKKD